MKPYGLPRLRWLEWPDLGDIKDYGLKSSIGKCKSKGGDFKSYFKSSENKRRVRRYFKKSYRMAVKKSLRYNTGDL